MRTMTMPHSSNTTMSQRAKLPAKLLGVHITPLPVLRRRQQQHLPRAVATTVESATEAKQQEQQAMATRPEEPRLDATLEVQAAPATSAPSWNWFQHWWPVAPLNSLDKERPQQVTLLGVDVVVWWSEQEQRWNVFQDRCPHRLAPLSQGRLSDSSLVCSYHGWTFNTEGSCTQITQMEPAAQAKVCRTKRTCVTAYPCMEEEGLLYAWMDPSPEGVELSKTRGVPKAPSNPDKPPGAKPVWSSNVVPNDWGLWLEQAMDPSHANFLHAGAVFKSDDAVPMAHRSVPKVDLNEGFDYEHGGYEKRNASMQATRHFVAPHAVIGLYRMPFGTQLLNTRFVPVRPGWTRTFAQFDFLPVTAPTAVIRDTVQNKVIIPDPTEIPSPSNPNPSAPGGAQKAAAKPPSPPAWTNLLKAVNPMFWVYNKVSSGELPHWLVGNQRLADEDVVMQHHQEVLRHRNNLNETNYVMPAVGADVGVAAIDRWLRLAKYPQSLFGDKPGHTEPLPLERLLNRHERHVQHCVQCQQGLVTMTRVFWALAGVSFISASFTLGLLASAAVGACPWQTAALPLAGLGAAAVLLGLAAKAAWDFREDRFISGVKSWRKSGGLSLVKMP